MLKQFVEIKTDFEATHNWPGCNIKEVEFLKFPHRHKILITVKVETTTDRQIEFFCLKMDVDKMIIRLYGQGLIKELGSKSMETICLDLLAQMVIKYSPTEMEISASEDGQVSGILVYKRD